MAAIAAIVVSSILFGYEDAGAFTQEGVFTKDAAGPDTFRLFTTGTHTDFDDEHADEIKTAINELYSQDFTDGTTNLVVGISGTIYDVRLILDAVTPQDGDLAKLKVGNCNEISKQGALGLVLALESALGV